MLTITTVQIYNNKVKNTYDLKTCDMMSNKKKLHNFRNLLFPLLSKYPACVQVLVTLPPNLKFWLHSRHCILTLFSTLQLFSWHFEFS